MREYSNKISLVKNSRGIYCLDTSIGCSSGTSNEKGGCYNDCYAAKSAKLYGYDFGKTILRRFTSERHKRQIVAEIDRIKLDFVRIGCSGDPSENWPHCFDILKVISKSNKQIVIITRHWSLLTDHQLEYLGKINVCINSSVSALDKPWLLNRSIEQYKRIKPFCRSILRIVSCDFNTENFEGRVLSQIQHQLFKNEDIIDTVFRPGKNNPLVLNGVVKVKKGVFNGNKQLMSKFNKKTFTGKCGVCLEMCGVKLKNEDYVYPNRRGLTKQLSII